MERFTIKTLEDVTYELDNQDGSLRLAWNGGQVFLSREETEALYHLLDDAKQDKQVSHE